MSFLATPIRTSIPDLTHDQLIDYLVRVDRMPLHLTGIFRLHAVFESSIKYPMTNKTKARYKVKVYIPLSDPMFQSNDHIDMVYPSKAVPWMQFVFDTYMDNSGIGRSWVE